MNRSAGPGKDSIEPEAPAGDPRVLLQIVSRLDPQQVAERWLSLVRKVPAEERLPDQLITEKAAGLMTAHLNSFTRLLVENRPPTEQEAEEIRQAALEWIGRGVSVEEMMHGVLLGATVSLQIAAEIASPDEYEALVFMTERMMTSLEHYVTALAPLRLDSRAQLIHDEERRSRSLVERLTAGGEITRGTSELAATLGFEIVEEYRPLVGALPRELPQAQFELASQLRSSGVLAYSDGVRAIGLVPGGREPALELSGGAVTAIGEGARRGALAEALADLTLLVDIGSYLGLRGRLALDQFPLQRLLLRSPGLAEMIERRVLAPLEGNSDLVETVDAMIACKMKRSKAAEVLHVHPGTIDYRMHRVHELAGLDLSRPEDLALTVLALERRALAGLG